MPGVPRALCAEVRLMPRLVLSGFTQLGCPIDAGIGASATYTVPLRGSMSLAFGAGLYVAPGQLPLFGQVPFAQGLRNALLRGLQGERSPVDMAGRVDLVWKTGSGRPLNLGVQTMGRSRQQVIFGGGF